MSTRNHEFAVHHVLVALDASTHSLAALRVAAELAAEAKAELVGLFVEDIRLLRLAKSPRAREVLYPASQTRPLNSATMEERFQAQAEQARRAMASQASHAQLRWSFRVVRGEVTAEVLAAASDADVLVMGKTGWSDRGACISVRRRWRPLIVRRGRSCWCRAKFPRGGKSWSSTPARRVPRTRSWSARVWRALTATGSWRCSRETRPAPPKRGIRPTEARARTRAGACSPAARK